MSVSAAMGSDVTWQDISSIIACWQDLMSFSVCWGPSDVSMSVGAGSLACLCPLVKCQCPLSVSFDAESIVSSCLLVGLSIVNRCLLAGSGRV